MLKSVKEINIAQLAQLSGWQQPSILIWREAAKKMRPLFLSMLYEHSSSVCNLDFSGVDTADGSFIDELIITEMRDIQSGNRERRFFFMSALKDAVLYNTELVFTKRRLATEKFCMLVSLPARQWSLFSDGLESSLMQTLDLIMASKRSTSVDVSKRFHISVPAASVRLKNLFDLGLIFRTEETTKTGREFVYESLF